jgi:hypothetical protein
LSTAFRFINTTTIVPTINLSIEILFAYTIVLISIAAAYFLEADISRKQS